MGGKPTAARKQHRSHAEAAAWGIAPVLVAVLAYLAVVGGFAAARHAMFQTQVWDLGVFVQSFWNTMQGRFFANSLEGASHLRTHFSPFLVLLVPAYAAAPSPYTLLWMQSLALALAALPLFALASARLGRGAALIVTSAYLLYPWLHAVNLFDFHEEPFAVPLIFSAYLAIERRRFVLAALCLALAALTKESATLVVVCIGGSLLLRSETRRLGVWVTLVAGLLFVGVSRFLMGGRAAEVFELCYGHLGHTPPEVLRNVLHDPGRVLGFVLKPERLLYVVRLLAPVAFVSLAAPLELIPALPILAQNLLSRETNLISNQYQYDVLIIPFLFLALVRALAWFRDHAGPLGRIARVGVAIAAVAGYLWLSPARPAVLAVIPGLFEARPAGADSLIARVPREPAIPVDAVLGTLPADGAPALARRRHPVRSRCAGRFPAQREESAGTGFAPVSPLTGPARPRRGSRGASIGASPSGVGRTTGTLAGATAPRSAIDFASRAASTAARRVFAMTLPSGAFELAMPSRRPGTGAAPGRVTSSSLTRLSGPATRSIASIFGPRLNCTPSRSVMFRIGCGLPAAPPSCAALTTWLERLVAASCDAGT